MRDTIQTARLILRPITACDIPAMVPQLDDLRVSANLARVPYPYTEKDAQEFVGRQDSARAEGRDYVFGVERRDTGAYVGSVGLHFQASHSLTDEPMWELGYWFGVPHWGNGFATEAGAAVLLEAEQALAPEQFVAGHFTENPKSGHVLVKLGFDYTGAIRDTFSLARNASVACHSMVRNAGAPLPDPGRAT